MAEVEPAAEGIWAVAEKRKLSYFDRIEFNFNLGQKPKRFLAGPHAIIFIPLSEIELEKLKHGRHDQPNHWAEIGVLREVKEIHWEKFYPFGVGKPEQNNPRLPGRRGIGRCFTMQL